MKFLEREYSAPRATATSGCIANGAKRVPRTYATAVHETVGGLREALGRTERD